MLRAVSTICLEGRALEVLAAVARTASATASHRDALALSPPFRRSVHGSSPLSAQTVVSAEREPESGAGKGPAVEAPAAGSGAAEGAAGGAGAASSARRGEAGGAGQGPGAPPPPPPPPPPPRLAWSTAAAVAAALTASFGGVYLYRKMNNGTDSKITSSTESVSHAGAGVEEPYPAEGGAFPAHVQYLVAGAGTAAFAALRALRSARPEARVLLVGEERTLPYMRPPLSKELWREPALAERARTPDHLTFRQWNGKRRPVVYEPSAFYTPVERLADAAGGAGVARGWRVARIDVAAHAAELRAPGRPPVVVTYDKCLVATGVRARRVPALREAAARGRSLALRSLADAAALAERLDEPGTRTVAVIGGGFLATELAASLADRLAESGKRVVQVMSEAAPMAAVLPEYLARDAARRLHAAGVELRTNEEVVSASVRSGGGAGGAGGATGAADGTVSLALSSGAALDAQLVVECVGAELDPELAAASSLEVHPTLGGLTVNAELQARADVWAAGDAACFYDVVLGRRRVEHHDHAVVSGRLAGHNMAGAGPPRHYTHQSMFWSDLGPQLGYEAIGIIDSRLPTVGIFSADAVLETSATLAAPAPASASAPLEESAPAPAAPAQSAAAAPEGAALDKEYSRGVVFYLREKRVVGVLLWNLFNRMHVARQVLAQGDFEDLFEVGKLFSPHEED